MRPLPAMMPACASDSKLWDEEVKQGLMSMLGGDYLKEGNVQYMGAEDNQGQLITDPDALVEKSAKGHLKNVRYHVFRVKDNMDMLEQMCSQAWPRHIESFLKK